jgi:NAD+--dinitrogen-reductase ADP-D-ribosyltransferase
MGSTQNVLKVNPVTKTPFLALLSSININPMETSASGIISVRPPSTRKGSVPVSCPFNRTEISPWVIASHEFNLHPTALTLQGVQQENQRLFDALESIDDPMRRSEVFHDYISVKFSLHLWKNFNSKTRKSLRNSYVRVLNGWAVDSNSIAGAVLKGWVESRFGISPTFHKGTLSTTYDNDDFNVFATDRVKGHTWSNAIEAQLDLLYTYCQYEIGKRFPGQTHCTLYRGTNDTDEHPRIATTSAREYCVRLNNLVSFTADRERAWEFGSAVWEVRIPWTKVMFFNGLLAPSILAGEAEYLVVGGEYWIRELLY